MNYEKMDYSVLEKLTTNEIYNLIKELKNIFDNSNWNWSTKEIEKFYFNKQKKFCLVQIEKKREKFNSHILDSIKFFEKSKKNSLENSTISEISQRSWSSRNLDSEKDNIPKYLKIKQLGVEGKEGKVFLVKELFKDRIFAMKCFKNTKSDKKIILEAKLQIKAAKKGISPMVFEIDTDLKYIIMEKMNENLFDILKENGGKLSDQMQLDMIKIFKSLDEIKVFHSDPNPLNFMIRTKHLKIIDFGFAKKINSSLVKKHETLNPNIKFMITGFILKMKEFLKKINSLNINQKDIKPRYKILEKFLEKSNFKKEKSS
jgi:tRNA A-37 threonylcarbamoyl transferase component Bud32